MPTAWQRIFTNSSVAATSFPSGTGTAAVTVNVNDVTADAPIRLIGILAVTTGVGVTGEVITIRRGGVGGTIVGATVTLPASASSQFGCVVAGDDAPGEVANQTYTLSLASQAGGSTGVLAYLMAVVG
jgi:hypothetical protein